MEFKSNGCDMFWEHGALLPQSRSLGAEGQERGMQTGTLNQDLPTNLTYASLHLGREYSSVLYPHRWSCLCALDTSDQQVSAYSALWHSTKIAQIMLMILLCSIQS